jgi:hypothetical protein
MLLSVSGDARRLLPALLLRPLSASRLSALAAGALSAVADWLDCRLMCNCFASPRRVGRTGPVSGMMKGDGLKNGPQPAAGVLLPLPTLLIWIFFSRLFLGLIFARE